MTGRPTAAVLVTALTKIYAQVEAVRSIDLEVTPVRRSVSSARTGLASRPLSACSAPS